MSTVPVRRLKDRGGAGGKITAAKPSLTPLSGKKPPSTSNARKSGSGKENDKSISRVSSLASQKPEIKPIYRSTSASRGRSSSPSDFTKILSDLGKNKVNAEKRLNGFRGFERKGFKELGCKVSEKRVSGCRVNDDLKENGNSRVKRGDLDGKGLGFKSKMRDEKLNGSEVNYGVDGLKDECKKGGNFCVLGDVADKGCDGKLNVNFKANCVSSTEKNGVESSVKVKVVKNSDVKGNGISVDKGVGEGGVGDKHPSKVHERLAFLEGKVKRIASDIKRTKDMLDMNNLDTSKIIISDIQEKISGIEKAMGDVVVNSSNASAHRSVEIDTLRFGKDLLNQNKSVDHGKISVKGMSTEELEARLFPHHKLLKDRTSLKGSALGSDDSKSIIGSSSTDKSTIPIDENPIALEFLASLSKEKSLDSTTDARNTSVVNEVQGTIGAAASSSPQGSSMFTKKDNAELDLRTDETIDEFDDQENKPAMIVEEETEENNIYQLKELGRKTSTGGWFVSEGDSVLLAHDDGSCSFYDIANHEEKSEYKPPEGISPNIWRDCWVIRASGADGCSGKYVVAASAGNTMDSGFCSWDFYSKQVAAFHVEDKTANERVILGPLADNVVHRINVASSIMSSENQQWWYRPSGPLIISTSSCQRAVRVFDIRDGEQVMKWDVQKPVLAMDYSSPLQWRNRGKVVIAEVEGLSVWDVSSQTQQALLSVSASGRRISALHVNNTDAEVGGGVRQRVSSSEAEGNDGVFCTPDSINILDFRQPSGIGLKIPKFGLSAQSIFSRGDSVFLGCTSINRAGKKQICSQVEHYSLRRPRLVNTYVVPQSNAHLHHKALTQVWGNSNLVMGVCGLGLFVFDALSDERSLSFAIDYSAPQKTKEIIGPDDLYSPSFDYLSSQILLISRDRPAMWRHLY